MGLAGPSKKRKISHDPNNTKWTRSAGFGHKMLLSQGWSPGTVLGPDPNNPHHTIASQVGIKVMLKDDTLGLGCRGNQEDTCTGLGDLQSLLGRLNGKTDESVKSEEDTRRKMWIEGRYGMRFVKGEVLESTWVTKGLKKDVEEDKGDSSDEEAKDAETKAEKEPDTEDEEDDGSEGSGKKKGKSKKEKKQKDKESNKKKRKSSDEEDEEDVDSSSSSEQDRKSDKAKRKAERAVRRAEKQAKKERKEAKRQRKDEKRRAKAEKKALKSGTAASSTPSSTASTPPAMPSAEPEVLELKRKSKSLPNSLHTSGTSTPVNGRQALRSKWIAQKKMAVMDAKALNEILMIKAA
ncbi:telomerase inhibitor [Orbilia javanica]|uniref:Telomerase inhibitor n=1 Tax=Orbilia javanica TaxID=47235 RepID=A0AAN8RDF6_9PEZI